MNLAPLDLQDQWAAAAAAAASITCMNMIKSYTTNNNSCQLTSAGLFYFCVAQVDSQS